jgi:hypothetical protein
MARTTPDAKIQTRAARARLPLQRKPHWLCLRPGALHLGYVRRYAAQAGHWTVRRYNGTYKVTRLPGLADDFEPANGADVLSFAQAQHIALRQTPLPQSQLTDPAPLRKHLVMLGANEKPQCYLYRQYHPDGTLLYVGISNNGWRRQKAHFNKAEWAHQIHYVVMEPFATRQEALATERRVIETEHPKYNKLLRLADGKNGD